jgi:vacuolar-type H+-ATPase subunit H
LSFEAKEMAEERKKAKETKAFSEAREKIETKAEEFSAEAEGQLSELRKRAVDGFKGLQS